MKSQTMPANIFLPNLVSDNSAYVISPIQNFLGEGDVLGHLIVFPNAQAIKSDQDLYSGKALTPNQLTAGIRGSFVFIGTNPNIFNGLFNNRFTGKLTDKGILVDQSYSGMISFQFQTIIKHYLVQKLI